MHLRNCVPTFQFWKQLLYEKLQTCRRSFVEAGNHWSLGSDDIPQGSVFISLPLSKGGDSG